MPDDGLLVGRIVRRLKPRRRKKPKAPPLKYPVTLLGSGKLMEPALAYHGEGVSIYLGYDWGAGPTGATGAVGATGATGPS